MADLMSQSWRDIHGYFIVGVRRDDKLVKTLRFDTKKDADKWAKLRRAMKDGVKVTVTRVEGHKTDFERGK